ncbi:phosphoribosyl-dephospho-CoA transferase [Granulicella arctica]|uniref:Phosphoribosyl-dephospho-CoA transferase n=1 Tax=Granulicella arctica TaxID=940613 RepID=A0A7Y9PI63_9BACT|nr:phosphoribosyl-dephospho-CoA transferase [Granulicella arctica]
MRRETLQFEQDEAIAFDLLLATPFVVVRRACPRRDWIPVGLRGSSRSERYGGWLHRDSVLGVYDPSSLKAVQTRRALPSFEALRLLQRRWTGMELEWGPVGSVGFELATGVEAVSPESDLDLLIQAPQPFSRAFARELIECGATLPATLDVQVTTNAGSFALAEYAYQQGAVALRQLGGSVLVSDLWCDSAASVA